jgi:putative membrane protein
MDPGMMWGRAAFGPRLGGWSGPMGLAMGLGWLTMLPFWAVLIAGGVLLVRAVSRSRSAPSTPGDVQNESPVDILKRRYAAGEITEAQYTEMRQVLER